MDSSEDFAFVLFLVIASCLIICAVHAAQKDNKLVHHQRTAPNPRSTRTVQVPRRSSNKTVLAIKRANFHQDKGGVILRNMQNSIAIEFYGPAGADRKSIEIEMVNSTMQRAELFLRGETFEVINLNNQEFQEFSRILGGIVRSAGRIEIDDGSGCYIFEGILP
jgi:hypothetical protein